MCTSALPALGSWRPTLSEVQLECTRAFPSPRPALGRSPGLRQRAAGVRNRQRGTTVGGLGAMGQASVRVHLPRAAAAAALSLVLLCSTLLPGATAITLPGANEEVITVQDPKVTEYDSMADELRGQLAENPGDFKALLQLGTLLARLDAVAPDGGSRVPEALASYRKALDLASDPQVRVFILTQMGDLLVHAKFFREASDLFNQTAPLAEQAKLHKTDTYAGMLLNWAVAEEELGRAPHARWLYRQALNKARKVSGPVFARAWLGVDKFQGKLLAELEDLAEYLRRKREGVDEEHLDEGEMDEWLDLQDRWSWLDKLDSQADQSCVSFALARAYRDKEDKEEEAWAALEEANALRSKVHSYPRLAEDDNVNALLRIFQVPKPQEQWTNETDAYWAALLNGQWGHREEGLRPVFLVGMPRSGAHLLERMLTQHPQVGTVGTQSALPPELKGLMSVLEAEGDLPTANITAAGSRTVAAMRKVADLDKPGARWVVDRMLPNLWNVGFISMALPDACIVHVARHPADQGLSCYEQPFDGRFTAWSFNLSSIAHQFGHMQRVADHWDAMAPGRVLHVRYEDLVRDKEGTVKRVMEHCELPSDAGFTESLGNFRVHQQHVQRYRQHAHRLAPLLHPLRQLITRYEQAASLESSSALLDAVLGGEGEEQTEEGAAGTASSEDRSSEGGSGTAAQQAVDTEGEEAHVDL